MLERYLRIVAACVLAYILAVCALIWLAL